MRLPGMSTEAATLNRRTTNTRLFRVGFDWLGLGVKKGLGLGLGLVSFTDTILDTKTNT